MKYVKVFKNLGRNDSAIAGGKGASLGEMTQVKIPVPNGFVILSSGFEYFLSENDLVQEIEAQLSKINHKEMEEVERVSSNIQAMILKSKMPLILGKEIKASFPKLKARFVAVRSSATAEDGAEHAWAGQLDSFLNTTSKDLEENIKRCFASLFTPRAIFYRFEKGLHDSHISVAVVIQKMVNSEKSGIAFSVHPVTEDRNQMIIEASWGLGEAIVSGQVTPDSYVIEKDSKTIIDTNIAEKSRGLFGSPKGGNIWKDILSKKVNEQCLSGKEIFKLSDLILKIESHYGFPCDIEWAFEKGKFYITQSRPITTLKNKDFSVDIKDEYPVFYKNQKLKWVKFLERKRTPFIYFPFIEIESKIIPKICGFRFFHHLYKWSGDIGVHYRVVEELIKCDKHFLKLIKKNDPRIKEWAKKGHNAQKLAEKWIKKFNDKPIPFSIDAFDRFYTDFIEVLLYTATMPYLVLSTIDTEITKGASRSDFEGVFSLYEPLRNTSQYPELERVVLNKWFNFLAKKYDIDPLYIHFMTPDEIRSIDLIVVDKGELKNRKDWSVLWNDIETNKIVFSFDKSLLKRIPVLHEHIEVTDTLVGRVAFPGYVKGVVRIVNIQKDITEFNQGDILVSINTNPDLIPIIKKSGAIVTDEGGIMCHAAIVSREFKIPCIIGTKIATKVLKDGDLVEVDAEKGVVKILKKAGEK